MIELRLYVAGLGYQVAALIDHVTQMLEGVSGLEYSANVVDVTEEPESALVHKVFATPTLARLVPPPLEQLFGDLANQERIVQELALAG